MKRSFWIGMVTVALAACGGRWAWRAHEDLVSLEVREMPVREVVKRLRWQTWEPIYVGQDVAGNVTLRVEKQPLEVVLNIINDQINGRWTALYPLYSSSQSLRTARALAQGEAASSVKGWTNWNYRVKPGEGTGGAGVSADVPSQRPGEGWARAMVSTTAPRVSLQLTNVPAWQAAAAVRQQSGARVIPEDGVQLPVTLTLENQPLDAAVAALARKTFRQWTRFYVFESRRPAPPLGAPRSLSPGEAPVVGERALVSGEGAGLREQITADPERQEEAIRRLLTRLKNSTPQQRVERDVRNLARLSASASR